MNPQEGGIIPWRFSQISCHYLKRKLKIKKNLEIKLKNQVFSTKSKEQH